MFRGVIDGLGHAIGLRFRKSGEALKKFCSSQLWSRWCATFGCQSRLASPARWCYYCQHVGYGGAPLDPFSVLVPPTWGSAHL